MGPSARITERNYYELLGVSPRATIDEIKLAYRDLSRIYDSDSEFYKDIIDDPPRSEHAGIFKLITEAFNTLSQSELRAEYDRLLDQQRPTKPLGKADPKET